MTVDQGIKATPADAVDWNHSRLNHGLPEVEFDGTKYSYVRPDEMWRFNFDLIRQIDESGKSFDRLVALARGGWTTARDLADGLNIPESSSMRYSRYRPGETAPAGKPVLVQPLTDSVDGEDLLLLDEVIDEGDTMIAADQLIRTMGAKSITIATLGLKPHSKIQPDFHAFETSAWVVFPHEHREFIEKKTTEWKEIGLKYEQILERLLEIGIPSNLVNYYLSRHWNRS